MAPTLPPNCIFRGKRIAWTLHNYSAVFSRMGSVWAITPFRRAVRPSSNIFSTRFDAWLDNSNNQTRG